MELNSVLPISFQSVHDFLIPFCKELNKEWLDVTKLATYISKSVREKMLVSDLYSYVSNYCASKISYHPDYNKLASRISINMLHRTTSEDFAFVMGQLVNNVDREGNPTPLISPELHATIQKNSLLVQNRIDHTRDHFFDYFGIKTLERSYLNKIHYRKDKDGKIIKGGQIVERPQHMFMRVALGIHGNNLEKAFETYDLMSNMWFTHATPTLFNAGSTRPQMSSCFLLHMGDSLDSIFETIWDIAKISKWAGGIGLSLSDIRAKGSLIRKTNGISDGIIPLCRVLNMEAKYVNQSGKRNGSIAGYLEPWHADVFEFCNLRRNTEDESSKSRDLFMALWVPDLFMKRVQNNELWSLMCPDECPGLTSSYGDDFEKLYTRYESQSKYKKQVPAVELWFHILSCQFETGMPFMLYKDNVNKKSNQKNLGTLKCSNLCTEILEYVDEGTTSVCNLASLCLPKFIITDKLGNMTFDYNKLIKVCDVIVRNLDIIIDKNFYPTPKTSHSNMTHRPVGVGVQGLADVFNKFGYPFGSKEARQLNKMIFETLYYGCLVASNQLAKEKGTYTTFTGSPASEGLLQFHLWNLDEKNLSDCYNWQDLIRDIKQYGLRNSLLTTVMPTASTSQIMGNSEAIDPYMSNVFTRSTLAGEFIVINENLVKDLIKLNLWSEAMRKKLIVMDGSIADLAEIPIHIKNIYKTAFEIKLKDVLQLSIDRGPFIDHSQSLNIYMSTPDFDRLTSSHFFGWKNGLKTGMYYLRSRPSVNPIQFGIEQSEVQEIKNKKASTGSNTTGPICVRKFGVKNIKECTACS